MDERPHDDAGAAGREPHDAPEPPEPRADEGNAADAALDDSLVDFEAAPPGGIEQEVLLDLDDED